MAPNQQRYSNQERKIAGPKQENHPLASFFLHPPPVSSAKGQRFLSVDASTPRHTVKNIVSLIRTTKMNHKVQFMISHNTVFQLFF